MITRGGEEAARRARKSLELENVQIEVRTTVFRAFSDVPGIAKDLNGKIALMSSSRAFLKMLQKVRYAKRQLLQGMKCWNLPGAYLS